MLSSELKQLKAQESLDAFLHQVNSPPSHSRLLQGRGLTEERKFRKTVLERLEKRWAAEKNKTGEGKKMEARKTLSMHSFRDGDFWWSPFCHCCMKNAHGRTEFVWRRMECKSLDDFETFATITVACNVHCIRCIKAICQSLSFWPDEFEHSDWKGLSVIGCYMWGLTFALQHIMDEGNPREFNLMQSIREIKLLYEEIAQSCEIFLENLEKFHEHTHRLRTDAVTTVKKMAKKLSLGTEEKDSPLSKRPETPQYSPIEPTTKLDHHNIAEEELDKTFQLNWSPYWVMVRNKKIGELGWNRLGTMELSDKISLFKQFAQRVVDILELEAESMNLVIAHISELSLPSQLSRSHAREISQALLTFSKSFKPQKGEDYTGASKVLQDYWFSTDILHEVTMELNEVIRETKNIVRTCYVYADVFYKLDLPSYECFLHPNKADFYENRRKSTAATTGVKDRRKSGKSSTTSAGIKEAWNKMTSREGRGRKLSEVTELLMMMDFSQSIYQRILELRPIEAGGGEMQMKLQIPDENHSEIGLISGTDVRKSAEFKRRKSKSRSNLNTKSSALGY